MVGVGLLIVLGLLAAASPGRRGPGLLRRNSTISYANLDGSGGGDLQHRRRDGRLAEGDRDRPGGGPDLLGQRRTSPRTISCANLDGSGGGDLPITGRRRSTTRRALPSTQPPAGSTGRTTRRPASEAIAYANLDGSGGGYLPTTGSDGRRTRAGSRSTPPRGGSTGRTKAGSISYASLDGSGGGDINTSGASIGGRYLGGVAIDPSDRRIFWAARTRESLVRTADLLRRRSTAAAAATWRRGRDVEYPEGVAIDPATGRAYWANTGGLQRQRLDLLRLARRQRRGGNLNLAGATTTPGIAYPALLKAPLGTGAPKLAAQIALRPRFLTCDEGTWAGDMPQAQLYRAPHSFSYQWLKDGQPIAARPGPNIGVEGTAAATTPAR